MRDAVAGKRRLGAAEEGWALIETLMAAVVLVIVVLGVYSALDSSTHAAGFDRQRTTAAALAEQDLERMRGISASGFTSDPEQQPDQAVGGTTYKIQSKAIWVYDSTGAEENCTDTTQASYLKISSTVTPVSGPGAGIAPKPVTMSSLMAPTVDMTEGHGTLAVRVQSGTGAPLPDAQVKLSSGDSRMTNAVGCAVFGYLPVGSYTVQAPANLVDKAGVAGGAVTANVTENAVKTVQLQVDTPATLKVSVQTKLSSGKVVADKSDGIVAANSQVPTGLRQFPATASDGTETLGALFPFSNGYTVYSGTCLSADPARYIPDYYASNPGAVTLGPGATGSIVVREPAMNIQVTKGGKPAAGVRVEVTDTAADCGQIKRVYTTQSDGGLAPGDVGLPFGRYKVCAITGTWSKTATVVDAANTDPDGTTVPVNLSSPTGTSCP